MLIDPLITNVLKPASLSTSVLKALESVDNYRLSHLPVFEGLTFLGCISELSLEEMPLESDLLESKPLLSYFFLTPDSTVFDAINVFFINDTNIIPVLNRDEKYIGYVLAEDVLEILSKLPLLSEPAALMTVKIGLKKYALSEVTKIVESNNGRLFGAFISAYKEDSVEITVKFIAENLASVSETFERFGYQIIYKQFNDEEVQLVSERYGQLMKYLEL